MRRMTRERLFLWTVAILLPAVVTTPAAAYVGPGAGLSLLGALWGVVIAVGAAIGFVVLWPLRRFLRKSRTAATPGAQAGGDSVSPPRPARPPQEDVSRHGAV